MPSIDEHHAVIKRLVQYVERGTLSLSSRTFASLANELGLAESSVRNPFDTCVKQREQQRTLQAPRILGIDEVHLLGASRCILTDIAEKKVLDLLENRRLETVLAWLKRLLSKRLVEFLALVRQQRGLVAVEDIIGRLCATGGVQGGLDLKGVAQAAQDRLDPVVLRLRLLVAGRVAGKELLQVAQHRLGLGCQGPPLGASGQKHIQIVVRKDLLVAMGSGRECELNRLLWPGYVPALVGRRITLHPVILSLLLCATTIACQAGGIQAREHERTNSPALTGYHASQEHARMAEENVSRATG